VANATVIRIEDAPVFQRGDGVITTLLVGKGNAAGAGFTSGLTRFPPGGSAPLHAHNCGEQVILLEGEGEVEVDGKVTRLKRYDTTYISAGTPHRFHATGEAPMLIIVDLRRRPRDPHLHRDRQDGRASLGRRHRPPHLIAGGGHGGALAANGCACAKPSCRAGCRGLPGPVECAPRSK